MGTPIREQILTNLKWTLEQITTANTYKTTVTTVERLFQSWTETEDVECPYIGIICRGEDYAWGHSGFCRATMDVNLVCHWTRDATQVAMREGLDGLLDDIIRRLMKDDPGLKGDGGTTIKAVSVFVDRADTDEESDRGGRTMNVDLRIIFNRTTSAS